MTPVKCIGLTSVPVQLSLSPNAMLVHFSTVPESGVRTRSVPSQVAVREPGAAQAYVLRGQMAR